MKIFKVIFHRLKLYWASVKQNARESEPQFVPLGIMGFIGFGIYYVIWHNIEVTGYENMPLRIMAMLLCLGLILNRYWPKVLRQFLPIYWYITLLYIMPFFFTFMLLKNDFSEVWITNSMMALFYMILLLDWLSSILLLAVGISLGAICYTFTSSTLIIPQSLTGVILAYVSVIGVGELLTYNRQQIQKDKIQAMQALVASIAHELRTPLRTISIGATSLRKLIGTQSKQQESSAEMPNIINNIETEAQSTFLLIDMLLTNLKHIDQKTYSTNKLSIKNCINQVLTRYPFDIGEKDIVTWKNENDFFFEGNELLITHVLFNLLKNALYYIRAAGKGEIKLWTETEANQNSLYFEDTGSGINKEDLPFIFDKFFSKTPHGSGIGLSFCKNVMENIQGTIECQSVEGKFTRFILNFKKLKDKDY